MIKVHTVDFFWGLWGRVHSGPSPSFWWFQVTLGIVWLVDTALFFPVFMLVWWCPCAQTGHLSFPKDISLLDLGLILTQDALINALHPHWPYFLTMLIWRYLGLGFQLWIWRGHNSSHDCCFIFTNFCMFFISQDFWSPEIVFCSVSKRILEMALLNYKVIPTSWAQISHLQDEKLE